jgi:O-antigen/teichoic acid export membrane protein
VQCTLAGSVVALVVNYWAVPEFGMLGAAWATASAYATMALALLFLIRPHYAVPYPWAKSLGLVALACVLLVLWGRTPALQVWWAELAGLGIYGVAAGATLLATLRR